MDKGENKTGKMLYVVCRTEFGNKRVLAATESWEFARKLAGAFGYVVEIYEDVAEKYENCSIGGIMPKMDSLPLDPFEPVGGDADGSADRNV